MTTFTAGDRTPFTYLVTHKATGRKYYGSRYRKGCQPSDLWTVYFTSSKTVKKLIELEGKEAFTFEIRKTFTSVKECQKWEERVLRRVYKSDKYLNKNCAGAILPLAGEDNPMYGTTRPDSSERMKKSNPMKDPAVVKRVFEKRRILKEQGLMKTKTTTAEESAAISQRMRETNPMSNPDAVARRKATIEAKYGGNHTAGSIWLANIITKLRKRVKASELELYSESEGWIKLSNRLPIPD